MRFERITRISDYFGIDPALIEYQGAINAILEFDSKYFIDPMLLASSNIEIIRTKALEQLNEHLSNVFRLLQASTRENDPAWCGAAKLLSGKEFPGISLGYGGTRTTGSNLDRVTSLALLRATKEVIQLGVTDPGIFLMMPLLIENIGADTISDITADAIKIALAMYTESVFAEMPVVPKETFRIGEGEYHLPRHPFQTQRGPIILVPRDIVAELPIASSWSEVADVSYANQQIRERFDQIALSVFKDHAESNSQRKSNALAALREVDGFAAELAEFMSMLRDEGLAAKRVPGLVALGQFLGNRLLAESQFDPQGEPGNADQAYELVLKIVSDFKFLIEERRMSSLLYGVDGKPFHEDVCQKLFFMVAYAHCRAWNIDITPEAETGNGPVDFKFSRGFRCRVAVEVKLSTNPKCVHGYESQLQRYMRGEETELGVLVFVDVGSVGKKWDRIRELAGRYNAEPVYVDAKPRGPASKTD